MCDACVINAVKNRMLSRRDMFRAVAGGAAAVAVGTTAAVPSALAAGASKVEDMTHEVHEDFPTYFGSQTFFRKRLTSLEKDGFNTLELRLSEHTGTHIDAPLHFTADGSSVAEIPVGQLVVPLCVIDIKARAEANADAQVTPDDIKAWIAGNGPIPDKACVAMNSGWDKRAASDTFRNADADKKMHFPGFHVEATNMLMEQSSAVGIAVDTLSLDHGISADFAVHYSWLPAGRWGIENIANLDAVPASGATLVVGAPKHRGGTGGPCRIFAMV